MAATPAKVKPQWRGDTKQSFNIFAKEMNWHNKGSAKGGFVIGFDHLSIISILNLSPTTDLQHLNFDGDK